jgi:hypothetical protein
MVLYVVPLVITYPRKGSPMSTSTYSRKSLLGAAVAGVAASGLVSPALADAARKPKPKRCPPPRHPLPPLLDSPEHLAVRAWTPVNRAVYPPPDQPPYDMTRWTSLKGWLGLKPLTTPETLTVVTCRGYSNPEGTGAAIVRALPLSSNIPSTAQILIPRPGPYLRVEVQSWVGANTPSPAGTTSPFAMDLWATNELCSISLITGDVILITEDKANYSLAASGPGSVHVVYPAGYYEGFAEIYLNAPPGVTATLFVKDLTHQQFEKDTVQGGEKIVTTVPPGVWFVFVQNNTGQVVNYDLTVTAQESARSWPPPKK